MTEDDKRTAASQKLFASGLLFREGAEAVLALGDKYAGTAAALCCQSAQRMITALTWAKKLDNEVPLVNTAAGLWSVCTAAYEELNAVNIEALFLFSCEWAGYPKEPWQQKPDRVYTLDAIRFAETLEGAILDIAPELAGRLEIEMNDKRGEIKMPITETDADLKAEIRIDFLDDEEKMFDFMLLPKDEFLMSYSYLTEEEYEATLSRMELLPDTGLTIEPEPNQTLVEEPCPDGGITMRGM